MIKFCKFHGFGNDYLVFAAKDLASVVSLADFVQKVCDRHRGIGADGVATFERIADDEADFAVRIFNPDGSEAGFSGNGTRCAVAHLFYNRLWKEETVNLRLSSGVKKYRLINKEIGSFVAGHYAFEAEIGHPKFDSESIPMQFAIARNDVVNFPLEIAGQSVLVTAVNVGNPVACVFVEDFDSLDWRKIGAAIETRATFPERTNVVFIKVADKNNLEIRIWERGAGETSSSGTCSVAAAVVSAFTEKTERQVSVHAPGGATEVFWRDTDDEIVLTGRADLAFCGEWMSD
jgi:diaminopimelate epimerase